jgi:hypothetical protein
MLRRVEWWLVTEVHKALYSRSESPRNFLTLLELKNEDTTILVNISIYQPARCNILENLDLQQHSCESLTLLEISNFALAQNK